MEEEPAVCQIHGLVMVKVTRRIIDIKCYDSQRREWRSGARLIPPEYDQIEYLCPKCDPAWF